MTIERKPSRRTAWIAGAVVLLSARGVLFAQSPGEPAAAPKAVAGTPAFDVPPWALGARWFQVDAPAFVNGDPANDVAPPGGDIQGLTSRLSFFKTLGIDVLYVKSVFSPKPGAEGIVDWLHVDPALTVKASDVPSPEPAPNRHKSGYTTGDRLFLEFVGAAHQSGLRVVLDIAVGKTANSLGPAPDAARDLMELSRRWMDPDADGKAVEGVDGWVVRNAGALPREFVKEWRAKIRSWNPAAIIVADVADDARASANAGGFDTWVGHAAADAVTRFLGAAPATMSLKPFLAKLESLVKSDPGPGLFAALVPPVAAAETAQKPSPVSPSSTPSTEETERKPDDKAAAGKPSDDPAARRRLAAVLQHFLPGAPMSDPSSAGGSDNVLTSLVAWLNARRVVDAPLRGGALRIVLSDEERRVFALARTLPGDEVILAVNFGDTNQRLMIPAGKPGALAAVLSLDLNPEALPPALARNNPPAQNGIQPLRMVGSRQFLNVNGQARVWVKPMSARYVLVQDR